MGGQGYANALIGNKNGRNKDEQRAMAKVRPPYRSAFRSGGGVPPRYAVIARPSARPAPSQAHGSLHELGSMWSN
eukprot:2916825-Pleurochrysis_carterae.AAC.1